ncbi:hypothetical protein GCM10010210_01070 [Pseudonocardia hydrocarbonoxydans]
MIVTNGPVEPRGGARRLREQHDHAVERRIDSNPPVSDPPGDGTRFDAECDDRTDGRLPQRRNRYESGNLAAATPDGHGAGAWVRVVVPNEAPLLTQAAARGLLRIVLAATRTDERDVVDREAA